MNLCARLVRLRAVQVTLLINNSLFIRARDELARSVEYPDDVVATHIRRAPLLLVAHNHLTVPSRLIYIGDVGAFGCLDENKCFERSWGALVAEEELLCKHSGVTYPRVSRPCVLIMDVSSSLSSISVLHPNLIYALMQTSAIDAFLAAKTISGDSIKVYGWQPFLLHFQCHFFGPKDIGGKGNVRVSVEAQARNMGKPFSKIAWEVRSEYCPRGVSFLG